MTPSEEYVVNLFICMGCAFALFFGVIVVGGGATIGNIVIMRLRDRRSGKKQLCGVIRR